MKAFHSNWTRPFFSVHNTNYFIDDFEILTTILSALEWRKYNGQIKMITDDVGAKYYKKLGIDEIWDLGISTILNNIEKDIDPFLFWAAGKIYALKSYNAPCVMIDTDFIVWKPVLEKLEPFLLCTIHNENIYHDVYPDKAYFDMTSNYCFDSELDWSVLPCNTAFTYIADEKFKQYYTQESINFMKNVVSGKDRIINMVFAEQRLISMCAKKMDIAINNLFDLDTLSANKQDYFTHTWGYKDVLRNNLDERKKFCIKCINRILKDFPEYKNMITNMEIMKIYYKEI